MKLIRLNDHVTEGIYFLKSKILYKIGTKTPYRLCSVCESSQVRIIVQKQTILTDQFHSYSVCSNKSVYNNLANKSNYMHKSVQYTYLFVFSTCFAHPCAPHQVKITETMCRCYLLHCMNGVWSAGKSE